MQRLLLLASGLCVVLAVPEAACANAGSDGGGYAASSSDGGGSSVAAPGSDASTEPGPGGDSGVTPGGDASADAAGDAASASDAGDGGTGAPADPFTLGTAPPISFATLVGRFGAGQTSAAAGAFTLETRTRSACNAVTGCTPWVEPSPVEVMESSGAPHALPTTGSATLELDPSATPPVISIAFAGVEAGGTASYTFTCKGVTSTDASSAANMTCDARVSSSVMWYSAQYLGSPRLDNTTLIEWKGRVDADGTYQFVSQLGQDLGTELGGSNNLEQIAIYGTL